MSNASGQISWRRQIIDALEQRQPEAIALVESLEPWLLKLNALIDAMMKGPPVPHFEAFLLQEGHDPIGARLLARTLQILPREHLEQKNAERELVSVVRNLAKNGSSTLRIAKRAVKICKILDQASVHLTFRERIQIEDLGISDDTFERLARKVAASRDTDAALELYEICCRVAPHLKDPRGRKLTLASVTREFLAIFVKYANTYDAVSSRYVDRATLTVMEAFDVPSCSTKAACRRFKKSEEPR
jgi:hypothetical protein